VKVIRVKLEDSERVGNKRWIKRSIGGEGGWLMKKVNDEGERYIVKITDKGLIGR
jgi:hypothetical protein